MYRTERNYENLNKGIFPGAGRFDIPILRPELTTAENWISFNYAKGCEEPSEHGVHFFVDDYQFNRIWAHPDNYLGMMARFDTYAPPISAHIQTFPALSRFTTITASTGWAPIGRPTASRSFRPSHGVHRIALHGALTVSR